MKKPTKKDFGIDEITFGKTHKIKKTKPKLLLFKMNNNIKEFKIICVSSCDTLSGHRKIEKGEIFDTNEYEFDLRPNSQNIYPHKFNLVGFIRIFINDSVVGLYKKSNFKKLQEYRESLIDEIISSQMNIEN